MTDFLSMKAKIILAKAEEMDNNLEGKDCVLLACDIALRQLDKEKTNSFIELSQPRE